MNLTSVNSYSAEMPTIDIMKKASAWITQCQDGKGTCTGFATGARGYDTLEEASLDLDASGWIKSLPASTDPVLKYRTVTTKLAEGGVQQAGNYTVVYDGQGTVTYGGAATKIAALSTPGHDIISIAAGSTGAFLNIVATTPTNYVRNIRVYMPGGACKSDLSTYVADASACATGTGGFVPFEKFPAGTVWHPTFLASLKGYRSLRFMDWGQTNYSTLSSWAQRTPANARTWNMAGGVPLENILDLAAKTGADPWMNVPAHATDDYVHQFAMLAHAHLGSGQKLAVEYGNEMWNYAFPSTQWAATQALATWPAAVTSSNHSVLELNWYAMRLSQVCNIVKTEFGVDAGRVSCVANTQAASSYGTDQVLQCTYAKQNLGQACSKFIDVVAIAPYFGYYIGNSSTSAAMTAWYTDPDGGLTKLFEELTGADGSGTPVVAPLSIAGTNAATGSLAQAKTWMVATKAVADKYGLPMWAYEGGQSLIPVNGNAKTLSLMLAANRDSRMGPVYQTMMQDWKNVGGQNFMFFADVGIYNTAGMWGLRENQFDTSAPKWKAAVQWRDSVACWWSGC